MGRSIHIKNCFEGGLGIAGGFHIVHEILEIAKARKNLDFERQPSKKANKSLDNTMLRLLRRVVYV